MAMSCSPIGAIGHISGASAIFYTVSIISFNPHNNALRKASLLSPFHRRGTGAQRGTEPGGGRAGIEGRDRVLWILSVPHRAVQTHRS